MGISAKWLRLVGIRKQEKVQYPRNEDNVIDVSSSKQDQKKGYVGHGSDAEDKFAPGAPLMEDAHTQSASCSTSSPTASNKLYQTQQTEEWAAIVIQAAFRAFLARRALRDLKGLVRLQALFRGYSVRKQAALTLNCMQALIRVQARVRASQVRVALESHLGHQKVQEQQLQEDHVKEIEDGWRDNFGSVEEIQAKVLKRQEAAAKRERAMAYALTHQWQAAKKPAASAGSEPAGNNWGMNWLDRWMAVRPWENRFLDANPKDVDKVCENSTDEGMNAVRGSKAQHLPAGKSNILNHNSNPSGSDTDGFSPNQSISVLAISAVPTVKPRENPVPSEEVYGEDMSQGPVVGDHSLSNTKGRSFKVEPGKRLPLQKSGLGTSKQGATKVATNQLEKNTKPLGSTNKIVTKKHQTPRSPTSKKVEVQT